LLAHEAQAGGDVADRFRHGRAFEGLRAGLLPPDECLAREAGLGTVAREQFGFALGLAGELLFKNLRYDPVEFAAAGLEQRLVGCVLNQGVLEQVRRLRGAPLGKQDLRLDQLGQLAAQLRFIQGANGAEQLIGKLAAKGRRDLDHVANAAHAIEPGQQEVVQCGGDGVHVEGAA
jgi:hypothetical protein